MLLARNFLTTYTPDGEIVPVKSIKKIVMRYLQGWFCFDALCLLPITLVFLHYETWIKYFYLIKSLRILKGIESLNPTQLMQPIHQFFNWNLDRKVKADPSLQHDINKDHNNIEERLKIHFILKILKLIILIFNLSFFVGHFWYIYCEIGSEIDRLYNPHHDEDAGLFNVEHFLKFFKLDTFKDNYHVSVTVMYYAFTSMSTVGFGDYHPRSDYERVLVAFILLFGVTIFSYIMGTF